MVKYASRDETKELLAHTNHALITLYMPTHRVSSPPHVHEDNTRYKNLVRLAEEKLHAHEASHDDIHAIVKQLEALMSNQEFWQHQTDGLAVYVSPYELRTYNLPLTIDEYVAADERYHLAPLMLQLELNQPYYVLGLAVHEPKLYKGDVSNFELCDVELPVDPESALNIDEMHVNRLQTRGARVRQPNTGNAPGIFHGHGGSPREIEGPERQRYFKMIDEIIAKHTDASLPLVLVGTDNMVTEYRGISNHKNIVSDTIDGNRNHEDLPEMHRLTWAVVQRSVIEPEQSKLLEQYDELIAQNRSVSNKTEVQAVSTEGRIDTLFAGMILTTTDNVIDQVASIPKVIFPENYESIDATAKDVFEQSGRVVGMDISRMPNRMPVAAILRY